jgi:PAS domain S-box-containing protein
MVMATHEKQGPAHAWVRSTRGQPEDLLDLLIEQVADYAIYVVDRAGNIASWNLGAQRIKGYTPDEIIGRPYELFFTEQDRLARKPAEILAAARQHGRYREEGWRVRKDGSRFWASIVMTALRDDSGEVQGFAKITRDLTEQRNAEEEARRAGEERAARRQAELDEREVRRSRDQLDLILRSIAEGVTAQDSTGRVVFANDAAAHLCGFDSEASMLATPQDQILGGFEIYREDGTPLPLEGLPGRIALVRGEVTSAVLRFKVKRTREERWSLVSAAPVFDAAGRVELSVTVFRDITERRRSERAWQLLADASVALGSSLDYQAALKRLAALAVPDMADWCGVDVLGADGALEQLAVAHVDPQKRELAKEWRRRWPPRPDDSLYRVARSGAPELIAEVTDAMIDAAATDPEQRRIARELGLRSAMIVPLIVNKEPFGALSFVAAESGRRYGPEDLILATEIGRRASLAVENARAYTEARIAVQTRDNFLAIASHELRTPLSALTVSMSSLLRAAESGRLMQLGGEGIRDRITKTERQTRQLARLVDRLLDVSRLSSRDLRLEREQADLAEIARDVVARYEHAATEAGSPIVLEIQGSIAGFWDRSRMDQVIANLVGNAIKYGAGTPVTLSMSAIGTSRARFSVSDRGPGIPLEHQERIFGQFERADGSDAVPGMGLGLWLARRIVTAHGGTITVDSSPGKGAVFTVILPVQVASVPGGNLPSGQTES